MADDIDDEELDEDLQDLLNQLDDQDEFLPTQEDLVEQEDIPETLESLVSTEETEKSNGKALAPVTGDEVVMRPVDELVPTDHRRMDDLQVISPVGEEVEEQVDLSKYLEQMDGVTIEVLQACRSDRQEAQDMINMLRSQIDAAHNKNNAPSRMYVDGLVKAVEVKAGINATAVKMMEGVSKMIAATKAGVNIQNNNLTVSAGELDDMLSQDETDDLAEP